MFRPGAQARAAALILALSWAMPALTAEPPQGSIPLRLQFSNSKGYMDHVPGDQIPDDGATVLEGADFSKNGNLTTRNGIFPIYGFNNPGDSYVNNNLALYVSSHSGERYLLARVQQKYMSVAYKNGNVPPGTEQTYNYTYLGENDVVTFNGSAYIVSDETVTRRLTEVKGSTSPTVNNAIQEVLITSSVLGSCAETYTDRMLVSCGERGRKYVNSLRLHYSAPGNPNNIVGYYDLDPVRENARITAIGPTLLGNKPIYTDKSTYLMSGTVLASLTGPGNATFRVIREDIGCIHHRTVKNRGNEQFFYSRGPGGTEPGIYAFNGVTIRNATKQARNWFRYLAETGVSTNTTAIPNSYVWKDSYCLNVATRGGVYNNWAVCIDEQNRVSIEQRPPVVSVQGSFRRNNFDGVVNVDGNALAMAGDDNKNPTNSAYARTIFDLAASSWSNIEANSSLSVPLGFRYRTKDFSFQNPGGDSIAREKSMAAAFISYENRSGTFTVNAVFDMGKSSITWFINSTTTYGQGASSSLLSMSTSAEHMVTRLMVSPNTKFRTCAFEIRGSSYVSIQDLEAYAVPVALK